VSPPFGEQAVVEFTCSPLIAVVSCVTVSSIRKYPDFRQEMQEGQET
jgi:hypothetical protein